MEDLTNKTFGNWTVLERSKNKDPYHYALWKCKCECGTIKDVRGRDLKNGQSKSCGCYAKKQSSNRNSKNLIGKTFGKLLVIEDSGERQGGAIMWKCKCLGCNDFVLVRSNHLIGGDTKSCRVCSSVNWNIINKKFYNLYVIEYNKEQKKYKCLCDCGNYTFVIGDNLKSGNTKSCGCIKSFGEQKIIQILQENNIKYIFQYKTKECRFPNTNYQASFDFYVDNKYIIEYDGEQHFKQGTGYYNNEDKFEKTRYRDEYKNKWCKENNIPLIRIPYTHLKDLCLEDLLLETTTFLI